MKKLLALSLGLALHAVIWTNSGRLFAQTVLSGDHEVTGSLTVNGVLNGPVVSGQATLTLDSVLKGGSTVGGDVAIDASAVDLRSSSLLFGVSDEDPNAAGIEWRFSEILDGQNVFDHALVQWVSQDVPTRWVWGSGTSETMVLDSNGLLSVGSLAVAGGLTVNGNNVLDETTAASIYVPVSTAAIAIGQDAHAGAEAVAIGWSAGFDGSVTRSGLWSVALGQLSKAEGQRSIAMGRVSWAEKESSIAIGNGSRAGRIGSVAIGEYAYSNRVGQVVLGRYNVLQSGSDILDDNDPILVLGNGTDSGNRSDAFIIRRDGDVEIIGDLRIQGVSADSRFLRADQDTLSFGPGSSAELNYSVALGEDAQAQGEGFNNMSSIAMGNGATAGLSATEAALGVADPQNWGGGGNSIALGAESYSGQNSVAIGPGARARAWNVALGLQSTAYGGTSVAAGYNSNAAGDSAVAIGSNPWVSGARATGIGYSSTARGEDSVAIGTYAEALRSGQIVIGAYNKLEGTAGAAIGPDDHLLIVGNGTGAAAAERSNALVIRGSGRVDIAHKDFNVADLGKAGVEALSVRGHTFIEGNLDVANQLTVGSEPVLTQSEAASLFLASGSAGLTMGTYITASGGSGDTAVALGSDAIANNEAVSVGRWAGSFGGGSAASGYRSVSVGLQAMGLGWASVAIGSSPFASGTQSIAVGYAAQASADSGLSIGNQSSVSGANGVAIGKVARAAALRASTVGFYTWTAGEDSLALGSWATTRSPRSVAIGAGTVAAKPGQVVVGAYNDLADELSGQADQSQYTNSTNDDNIFVVASGSDDTNRSNAFTVNRGGSASVKGSLTVVGDVEFGEDSDNTVTVHGTVILATPSGGISMGEFE